MSTIAAQAGILSADAMIENARSMAGIAKVGAEATEGAVPRDAMRRVQRAWVELADALEYCQEVMAESIRDGVDVCETCDGSKYIELRGMLGCARTPCHSCVPNV